MTESGLIDVAGARIYAEANGEGHALLLMHAGVANLRMWDPQVPRFAERYRVIRFDTRGYGRTEADHVAFTNYGDVGAVLDHFGVDSAYLLGASRSGGIALDFTLEQPDRVDALVVAAGGISGYESPADAGNKAVWAESERMWDAHDWDGLADFETQWWVDGPGQPSGRVDPQVRSMVHDWILTTYQAEKEEGLPEGLDRPATRRLAEIAAPTLVVVGDLDDPGTVESCQRLAAEVPGARLEIFEGAAHMLNLEQPDRFTGLVLDFLAEVDANRTAPI